MKLVLTLTQDNNAVVAQVSRPFDNANNARIMAALRSRLVDPAGPAQTDVQVFQLWANDIADRLKAEVMRFESIAAAAAIQPAL